MTDIVKRLRSDSQRHDVTPDGRDYTYTATPSPLELEAAKEIERLRAALSFAQKLMRDVATETRDLGLVEGDTNAALQAYCAALEGKDG